MLPRQSRPANTARRPRFGRVPLWLPLGLVCALAILLRGYQQRRVAETGYELVDTSAVKLQFDQPWADARWGPELESKVAELAPFQPTDASAVEGLLESVRALSFVREARAPRVLWPGGLELQVELRRPVACAQIAGRYFAVDADGLVLSGFWSTPPYFGFHALPVIGPNDGALEGFQPGHALVEARHLDALDVACSLWEELEPKAIERLGRCLIDASDGRSSDLATGGVRLLLEDQRVVLFGRAPAVAGPGELPSRLKWQHFARGLALLDRGSEQSDWALLDVRWDEPELRPRTPPSASPDAGGK
jgi:hypothetical protein